MKKVFIAIICLCCFALSEVQAQKSASTSKTIHQTESTDEWMSLTDIQDAVGYTTTDEGTIVLNSDRKKYTFDKVRVDYSQSSSIIYCYITIDYANTETSAFEFATNNSSTYYINDDKDAYNNIDLLKENANRISEYVYEYDLNSICHTTKNLFYVRSWQKYFLPEQVELHVTTEATQSTPVSTIFEGTCGEYLTWTLNSEDSIFSISGYGEMYDYDYWGGQSPWTEHNAYIKQIRFPEELTRIGSYAFAYCSNLESVRISENITSIGSYAFEGCDKLATATIDDNVIDLEHDAFLFCHGLESVVIGRGVQQIGYNTFYDCTSLTSVTMLSETPPAIDGSIFSGTPSSLIIYVPCGTKDAYREAFSSDMPQIQELTSDCKSDSVSQISIRTLLVETSAHPMIVGGYIDNFKNVDISKKGIIVGKDEADMIITESTEFETLNYNTASGITMNYGPRYIDCSNVGNEEYIVYLRFLEGNQNYLIRAFAIIDSEAIYGDIQSIETPDFKRNKDRGHGEANVWYLGSNNDKDLYSLFDLVTDEVIDVQKGFYYSTNENPTRVNYQTGTGYNTCYKFLTEWNYKLWYYHNTIHCAPDKVISLPLMTYSDGYMTISAAEADADKSLTFYYSVDGDGRRPETFTSVYSTPIEIQENSVVYCYAISSDGYISYTNAYMAVEPKTIDQPTSIVNTSARDSGHKFLLDGQLLILRNGKTYTVQGQEVK